MTKDELIEKLVDALNEADRYMLMTTARLDKRSPAHEKVLDALIAAKEAGYLS